MRHYVYLSGPITGLSYDHSEDWRNQAKALLSADHIHPLSPLRAKEALREIGIIGGIATYGELTPLATQRGIMTRDHHDTKRSTVILVNLTGAEKISIGTVMEIAWAHAYRIPVVAVMPAGNPHEHCMVLEAIDYRVDTLEEACAIVRAVIG